MYLGHIASGAVQKTTQHAVSHMHWETETQC